jgi:hypothetical protein
MLKIIPRKFFLLLFLATFIIKLGSAYYMAHLRKCLAPESTSTVIASKSGDAPFYIDPIENYIVKGEYFYNNGTEKITMGRAPYYGITYFIFRIFLPQETSYDMVAILQLLVESLAIIYLSALGYLIIKHMAAFLLTYLLMMVSLNYTFWSSALLTESLTISFLIFFSWHYYQYLTNKTRRSLFFSGLFLSFTVLLKPYFVLLFVPVGILFLLEKPFSFKNVFLNTVIVCGTLIVLSIPYTVRNLVKFNKFMPGTQMYGGYEYSKSNLACREFIRSWGGSIMYWDKRSAACYFEPVSDVPCEFVFPEYALCEEYSLQDVEAVRDLYLAFQKNPSPALDDSVAAGFSRLTSLYKKNKPLRYYFVSPLLLVKNFLFHSGSYYLSVSKASPCYAGYQFLLKVSQSVLYYLSLVAGLAGLILIFRRDRRTYMLLFIPVYLILFFPIGIRATEFRYFAPSYPFLILGTVYLCFEIYQYIKKSLPSKTNV